MIIRHIEPMGEIRYEKCQCGEVLRMIDMSYDYFGCIKTCKCGRSSQLPGYERADRFLGLSAIYDEHWLQHVPGYNRPTRDFCLPWNQESLITDEDYLDEGPWT